MESFIPFISAKLPSPGFQVDSWHLVTCIRSFKTSPHPPHSMGSPRCHPEPLRWRNSRASSERVVHRKLEEKPEAEKPVRIRFIKWGDEIRLVKQIQVILGRKIGQVKYQMVIVGEEVDDKRGTTDNYKPPNKLLHKLR